MAYAVIDTEKLYTRILNAVFLLNTIKDHRRGQGKRYDLAHVLQFSIMALLSNADSYRNIHDFMDIHRERLNEYFGLDWKKAPAYTTIRNIILNTSGSEIERVFREHGWVLAEEEAKERFISIGQGINLRL